MVTELTSCSRGGLPRPGLVRPDSSVVGDDPCEPLTRVARSGDGDDHDLYARPSMNRSTRAIGLILGFMLTILAATPVVSAHGPAAAAGATPEVAAAEQAVIDAVNAKRTKRGLRALRLDPRIAKLARARSQDMIDRDYFAHTDPDGRTISDLLRRARIRFSRSSEMIAWTQSQDLEAAAASVVEMWMGDSIHRHEVLSKTHDYFGAGVATSGRKVIWTVDSITGPDRTDPTARITGFTGTDGHWTVTWKGSDPRLVTGTAGLRDYDLGRRLPDGMWAAIRTHTTAVQATTSGPPGTQFRVRARDKAGNVGAWSSIVTTGQ